MALPRRHHWRSVLAAFLFAVLATQSRCRAQQPWPLWQHYQAHFLDSSGRIVDHTAADRTTSEAQAYGMFFALVANDRALFDKMLRWTEDNLAAGDLTAHLPAWQWGKAPGGDWKPLDTNSAADADLWLAYDCLEAGRLWRDDRLSKLGGILAENIAQSEVTVIDGLGTVLLPGPQGFRVAASGYLLNPSYVPPQLLARLRQQQPSGPWARMQTSYSTLIAGGAPSGFVMDWVVAGPSAKARTKVTASSIAKATVQPSPSPDALAQSKTEIPPMGSYDAIRVYLWLGMADPQTPGVRQARPLVAGMAHSLQTALAPPAQVAANGIVLHADSPVGFSAAVLPYLQSAGFAQLAKTQSDRLDSSVDPATGLYGHATAYYDQNLALFAKGWADRRFRFDRDGHIKVFWQN